VRKHKGEPGYLVDAIRLRVKKIAQSKHSLDVNVGAPMPPPPNILELDGPHPYMVCQRKTTLQGRHLLDTRNNYEKAIECLEFAAAARPNDDLIQLDLGLPICRGPVQGGYSPPSEGG
jgi:hypothetical protein